MTEFWDQMNTQFGPAYAESVARDHVSARLNGRTAAQAVEDGVPYAIDFMNPAPDADLHSVGQKNFDWIVTEVAKLAVKKATAPAPPAGYRWDSFLKGPKTL